MPAVGILQDKYCWRFDDAKAKYWRINDFISDISDSLMDAMTRIGNQ